MMQLKPHLIRNEYRYLSLATCTALILASTVIVLIIKQHHVPGRTTGNDISWQQCTSLSTLPAGQAFGIVDVNSGLASNTNPCLADELAWAGASNLSSGQPKTILYVNTGNPGEIMPAVANWPKTNFDIIRRSMKDNDPYGSCTGGNDAACAWQYGYNMANLDANKRGVTNPKQYTWYLDVETENSWTDNLKNNAADLEGMVSYFGSIGAPVGLYGTESQWAAIIGPYGSKMDAAGNSLIGLPAGCRAQPTWMARRRTVH